MTKEQILNDAKAFLIDLDGTLYLGERVIAGAEEALAKLRALGKKLVFLTNNSSKTAEDYQRKLTQMGLFRAGDLVYTSAVAAAEYLNETYKNKRVFLLATEAVKREFALSGVQVCEEKPDVCVLAYDTELTYEKICKFDAFLKQGLPYLATHADDVCPKETGSVPDAGSFLALFLRSSKRLPDLIIGKPYVVMAEGAARRLGLKKEELCMIGDRAYTDIRFANQNGLMSVLVLSGETKQEDLMNLSDRPGLVLGSIAGLFEKEGV